MNTIETLCELCEKENVFADLTWNLQTLGSLALSPPYGEHEGVARIACVLLNNEFLDEAGKAECIGCLMYSHCFAMQIGGASFEAMRAMVIYVTGACAFMLHGKNPTRAEFARVRDMVVNGAQTVCRDDGTFIIFDVKDVEYNTPPM
jgi:hypothetical protein